MLERIKDNKKIAIPIIAALIILELFFVFLSIRSYDNKDVKQLEKETEKETFNTYVQVPGTNKYELYTGGDLYPDPTNYVFNNTKSYCLDLNDEKIDNPLTVNEDQSITLTSSISAYCFLYFDNKTA